MRLALKARKKWVSYGVGLVVRAGLPRLGAFSGLATTFGTNLPDAPNEPLVVREPRPTNVSAGG